MEQLARTRYPSLTSRLGLSSIQGPSGVGARMASRTTDILTSELNKMSNFFLKRAEAQAEIEGAEFGAKNAITEKQLRDGLLSGEELENQLGDTNTVFGRASRKAQLAVLETELELSARKQISEVMSNAVTNDVDADTLADDLDAVTLEYSKLAFDASPIVSQRLTASLNTVSSSKYHDYVLKKANQTIKITRAKNLAIINNKLEDVSEIINQAVNESENEKQIDEVLTKRVPLLKQQFFSQVTKFAKTSKPIEDFLNKFDEEVKEARNSYVLKSTLQSGKQSAVARAIATNNYSKIDFRLKKVIATMSDDEKLEMFKKLNTQAKEVQDAEDQDDQIAEQNSQNKIIDLKLQITEALGKNGRDLDKAKTLLGQLKVLDRDGDDYLSLSKTYIKTLDESDPDTLRSLQDLSDRGILTAQALTINADKLSSGDLDKLRNELKTIQSKKLDLALIDLTAYFNTEIEGFDPKIVDNLSKRNQFLKPLAQYKQIKKKLSRALEDAQAQGIGIDLQKLAKDEFDNFKKNILDKAKEQNIQRANKVYDKIKTIAGRSFPQLDEFESTDHVRVLQFIAENKGKLFGDGKAFTQREYKTFTDNLKKAMQQ
tara:strand:+ start:1834 stop:3636 length:1803 start_codon:yes stop_codon:yes gene_type:complete